MRVLSKLLTLAALTGAALVGVAAPASANHQCSEDGVCLVTDAVTIPVGTPTIPVTGAGYVSVPGPRLCDSTTGECRDTYVRIPGAFVASNGTTVTSITIPSLGVAIADDGRPVVYYGIPSADFSSAVDVDLMVAIWIPVVPMAGFDELCPNIGPEYAGPVAVTSYCWATIFVQV